MVGSLTYIKLLMTAFIWGGTFVAGRLAAEEVTPVAAAFFRFLFATAGLLILTPRLEGALPKLTGRQFILTLIAGLFSVVLYNLFFFEGLKSVPAGRAAVIIAGNPIFIFLFSALLFGDVVTPLKILGVLLSFSGAVAVITHGDPLAAFQGGVGWGELFILGCVASWVGYSLIGKVLMVEMKPMASVTYACIFGTLGLLIPMVMETDWATFAGYSSQAWICLAYLGLLGSTFGFTWYYQGIKTLGPARAGVFINFVPISGVLLGWLILDETIDLTLIIGVVLVVAGVYLINRRKEAV